MLSWFSRNRDLLCGFNEAMNSDVASEVSTVKVGRCDGNGPSHRVETMKEQNLTRIVLVLDCSLILLMEVGVEVSASAPGLVSIQRRIRTKLYGGLARLLQQDKLHIAGAYTDQWCHESSAEGFRPMIVGIRNFILKKIQGRLHIFLLSTNNTGADTAKQFPYPRVR